MTEHVWLWHRMSCECITSKWLAPNIIIIVSARFYLFSELVKMQAGVTCNQSSFIAGHCWEVVLEKENQIHMGTLCAPSYDLLQCASSLQYLRNLSRRMLDHLQWCPVLKVTWEYVQRVYGCGNVYTRRFLAHFSISELQSLFLHVRYARWFIQSSFLSNQVQLTVACQPLSCIDANHGLLFPFLVISEGREKHLQYFLNPSRHTVLLGRMQPDASLLSKWSLWCGGAGETLWVAMKI